MKSIRPIELVGQSRGGLNKMRDYPNSLTKYIILNRLNKRLLILFYSFVSAFFGLMSPFFQKIFVDGLVEKKSISVAWLRDVHPILILVIAVLSLVTSQILNQLSNYLGLVESLLMQKKIAQKIYDKILELKLDTTSNLSIGEIVSIYATDVPGATVYLDQTLPSGASTFFPLIITPFALVIFFDTPIFFTVLSILTITLLNTYLAFRQSIYFYKFKRLAAERLGLANEWIQNIRTLRILGWITILEKKILSKRIIETENRVTMVTNGQAMNSISSTFTFIINFLTLGLLIFYYKRTLTAGEIFAMLWILGIFLTRPFRQMPWFFTFGFDAATSIKRIEGFLSLKNTTSTSKIVKTLAVDPNLAKAKVGLEIKNLELIIQNKKILSVHNFSIQPGDLVMLAGEVGSGKTLFLLSLLNQTNASFEKYDFILDDVNDQKTKPDLRSIGYIPQEGLIVSTNLRDNIHLHYESNHDQDSKVLESTIKAQLSLDLNAWEKGLDTEFGERGVNLSGGQKQRVNMARAIYNDRPILFMDDCFSALDSETEHLIFEHLILKEWHKKKTIVLASHRLNLLPKADYIYFFKNGSIVDHGSYDELILNNSEFKDFCKSNKDRPSDNDLKEPQ